MNAVEEFKDTFEEIQRHITVPGYKSEREYSVVDLVHILFRVALENGVIAGEWHDEDEVRFQVGDVPAFSYAFGKGVFRTILAAIGASAGRQLGDQSRFNLYGDTQEISYEIGGQSERFLVETQNRNLLNLRLHFLIRKI